MDRPAEEAVTAGPAGPTPRVDGAGPERRARASGGGGNRWNAGGCRGQEPGSRPTPGTPLSNSSTSPPGRARRRCAPAGVPGPGHRVAPPEGLGVALELPGQGGEVGEQVVDELAGRLVRPVGRQGDQGDQGLPPGVGSLTFLDSSSAITSARRKRTTWSSSSGDSRRDSSTGRFRRAGIRDGSFGWPAGVGPGNGIRTILRRIEDRSAGPRSSRSPDSPPATHRRVPAPARQRPVPGAGSAVAGGRHIRCRAGALASGPDGTNQPSGETLQIRFLSPGRMPRAGPRRPNAGGPRGSDGLIAVIRPTAADASWVEAPLRDFARGRTLATFEGPG